MTSREELLAEPLATAIVTLPNGKTLKVRELTQGEAELTKSSNALVFAYGVINENGSRLFDPNDPDDIAKIKGMGLSTTLPVVEKISMLSGTIENKAKN